MKCSTPWPYLEMYTLKACQKHLLNCTLFNTTKQIFISMLYCLSFIFLLWNNEQLLKMETQNNFNFSQQRVASSTRFTLSIQTSCDFLRIYRCNTSIVYNLLSQYEQHRPFRSQKLILIWFDWIFIYRLRLLFWSYSCRQFNVNRSNNGNSSY